MPKDYKKAIKDDLIEQFRGKKNIEDLSEVVAEQLEAVMSFFEELPLTHDIDRAEGAVLDGIGELVGLSRGDAADIMGNPYTSVSITDDEYRSLIKSKILRNTGRGTYSDIIGGIKLFTDIKKITYEEKTQNPATFFVDFNGISWNSTGEIREAKASGVKVVRTYSMPEYDQHLYSGAALQIIKDYTISDSDLLI